MFSKRTGWPLTPNRFTLAHRQLQAAGASILDLTVSNPTNAGIVYDTKAILESLRDPR
jgi:hypothetical protein